MDYLSIKRLGLDHYNIDVEKSDEIFDSVTNNYSINAYFLKEHT